MKFLQTGSKKQKRILLIACVLGLAVVAAAGWLWQMSASQWAASSAYETSAVTRGDISMMASGTGTVVAGHTADLSFPVSGTVSQLNIKLGDEVLTGDILAVLDGREKLEVEINTQQVTVTEAQAVLDALTGDPDAILAQAKLNLAEAQRAYDEAKENLHTADEPRCSADLIGSYWGQYQDRLEEAIPWEKEWNDPETIYGWQYIMEHLHPIWEKRDAAYNNWNYCQGYTEQEIIDSEAALMVAEANLKLAQQHADAVEANEGVDQEAIDLAQARLDNAQAQLTLAQEQLEKLVITAPIDGTVTKINGAVGDKVDTATFITLVDMDHPELTIFMDETDLENISTDCDASVEIDSITGRTFSGTVTELSPVLSGGMGYSAIEGKVELDAINLGEGQRLPIGLSATVDVTCKSSTNVALVSLDALHTLEDGRTVAYVLNSAGEVEEREVETGVQNYTLAEVISGLSVGESVITDGLEISG